MARTVPQAQHVERSQRRTVVEVLYPEFGNQAGDNGNAMYLRACLPDAEFIDTPYGAEPAFATRDDVSCILLGNMTERQQERVAAALAPHRDRLLQLADAGTPILFTGNAAELLGRAIVAPDGTETPCLGIFDIVARQLMPTRITGTGLGTFRPDPTDPQAQPIDVVGFKMQFTQMDGDNSSCAFVKLKQGFGLRAEGNVPDTGFEGLRRNNLIGTWFLGPLLTINPPFTRWLLDAMGEQSASLKDADIAQRAYEQRVRDFATPGMDV